MGVLPGRPLTPPETHRTNLTSSFADIIGYALEFVRTYVKSFMRKLSVVTGAQMIEAALRMGVIDSLVSIAPYGP